MVPLSGLPAVTRVCEWQFARNDACCRGVESGRDRGTDVPAVLRMRLEVLRPVNCVHQLSLLPLAQLQRP